MSNTNEARITTTEAHGTTATAGFSVIKRGRRHVILGDTRVAPKGHLGKYGVGLNFDPDTCEWWSSKADLVAQAVAELREMVASRSANASYRKLPSGSWGVLVPEGVEIGPDDSVVVRKSSGDTKRETIGAVISADSDGKVYMIIRTRRTSRTSTRSRYPGVCRAHGCHNAADQDADHCRAQGGYCGGCAYDEM